MSDIKPFAIGGAVLRKLDGHLVAIGESLQNLIEGQLECVLVARFLASKHATEKPHGGRIDTLREYRSALISAAVTGKLDVRGEVT